MKNQIKVSTIVRSHFRARWTGEVKHIIFRKGTTPLLYVAVTHDSHGKPQRKPFMTRIDSTWCTVINGEQLWK